MEFVQRRKRFSHVFRRSPKIWTKSSEAPFATRCCSVKLRSAVDEDQEFDDARDFVEVPGCGMQRSHQFYRDAAGGLFSLGGVEFCAELCRPKAWPSFLAMCPETKMQIAGTDKGHKGSSGRCDFWKRNSQRFKFFVDRHFSLLWLKWEVICARRRRLLFLFGTGCAAQNQLRPYFLRRQGRPLARRAAVCSGRKEALRMRRRRRVPQRCAKLSRATC